LVKPYWGWGVGIGRRNLRKVLRNWFGGKKEGQEFFHYWLVGRPLNIPWRGRKFFGKGCYSQKGFLEEDLEKL